MDEIICLGKTDNGMVREERYSAKSRHGQRRAKEIHDQSQGNYIVDVRNVGSRETVLGRQRCIDLVIWGKKKKQTVILNDKETEVEQAISTDKVPEVKMVSGEIA